MNIDDLHKIETIRDKLQDLTNISSSIRELINLIEDEDVKKLCRGKLYKAVNELNEINTKG